MKHKVVTVLMQVPHHENIWGVDVQLHTFTISVLDGGEWSASCPGQFTPRDTAPHIH